MTELTQLIVCSLGIIVFFGSIVRQNQIDDAKRLKRIFVENLKFGKFGNNGIPRTTESVRKYHR